MDLLVKRDDLHTCRVVDAELGDLKPDQVRLAIDSFGLTTNNISYAVFGEAMSYWAFFPAEEGWGRVPVWGFATVEAGGATDLEEGRRIFGYLPPASHLVVTPAAVDARGFVDAARHRADLPAAYNRYAFVDAMEAPKSASPARKSSIRKEVKNSGHRSICSASNRSS
jgi:Protein of unknown function (DUF2855)